MERPPACPNCSEDGSVRKSHFRPPDYLQLLRGRRPYRCLTCNHRFHSFGRIPHRHRTEDNAWSHLVHKSLANVVLHE
jgi:hypothetical protein